MANDAVTGVVEGVGEYAVGVGSDLVWMATHPGEVVDAFDYATSHPGEFIESVVGGYVDDAKAILFGDYTAKGRAAAGLLSPRRFLSAFRYTPTRYGGSTLMRPNKGPPIQAGEVGAYSDLVARGVNGDDLTAHHMPQAAMGFTTRAEGGSLVLPHAEHVQTRTYGGRGGATLRAEKGMSFRDVLARDMRDIRRRFGPKYDQGLRDLVDYYKKNFPNLISR